jgi:hypothetical protein
VFANGYITAMRPTLAISVAILLAGAVACVLLRRSPAVLAPAARGETQAEPASTRLASRPGAERTPAWV